MSDQGNRIDHIRRPEFVEAAQDLPLDELRRRRDECLAEREYLSFLRRLLQGRAEILRAELERRDGMAEGPLVEGLATILGGDAQGPGAARPSGWACPRTRCSSRAVGSSGWSPTSRSPIPGSSTTSA